MALLNILQWPDPRLKTLADRVSDIDQNISTFIDNLFETMYAADGVGLAATQVNVHQRIIAIDVSRQHREPLCLINPVIVQQNGQVKSQEGCLSFPGVYFSFLPAFSFSFLLFSSYRV